MANAIRALAMDAVEQANSGHPGLPMGAADVATVLFSRFLKYDPAAPDWPDRDRFVLSAGHGSMLLYAVLHLLGVEEMTIDELKRFRQLGSKTPGHPEYGHVPGAETTTGPLGQGLAMAVGMAIAERLLRTEFGAELVDHRTYVLASDGDLMEGISHEAISLAGHLKLDRLVVLYDDNGISIDGPLSLSESGDPLRRFEAAGWDTRRVDGHNPDAIAAALDAAQEATKPVLIACRTQIGYGAPTKAGTHGVHGSPLGAEEIAATRRALVWDSEPFHLPSEIVDSWRLAGLKAGQARKDWERRVKALEAERRAEFERRMRGDLPLTFADTLRKAKQSLVEAKPKAATRKASETALEVVNAVLPETVGGSADLSPSNNTRTKGMKDVTPDDFAGRYIHYGIREFGMAAAMNGMALHGGVIPYGGTFLVFSDYCRPAIRLSALMGQRVVYVMTHDSIGLGEDGPTHQPVEHLASLRAIPNLTVLRPADAVETLEAWEVALNARSTPTVLALSRQNLRPVRTREEDANLVARGAYELAGADGEAEVTIFASGSEVGIALDAKARLDAAGHPARVVSVPSFELFARQSAAYRGSIIGAAPVKIAVEAAIRMGWDRFIGSDGLFVGMEGFGASAPAETLYAHFGITADAVFSAALARIEERG